MLIVTALLASAVGMSYTQLPALLDRRRIQRTQASKDEETCEAEDSRYDLRYEQSESCWS